VRGFLLDTNVISELRRPRPDNKVVQFVQAQTEDILFISEVTLAEIRFGIAQVIEPERRAILSTWLAQTVRPLFTGRIIALTEDVILRWRIMVEAGRRRGHTFSQLDLFIAAAAAESELIVVSRDVIHFVAATVPVLDPWSGIFTDALGSTRSIAPQDGANLLS
jgi:predicted nucleic acid-binding protein